MEAIKDVGKIIIPNDKDPLWRIPNFYDLPQEHNTVIRSPRFHYNDTEWYMEVYPDGRKLYSSSGWFGISVLDLNTNSNFRNVTFGIIGDDKKDNIIFTVGESNGEGFYSCIRFLPRLFLKSRKDLFAKGGDLCLLFSTDSLNNYEDDAIYIIQLITEDDYGLQHSTLKMTKISNGESNGEGFYSCVRFLPRLFLKSRKDLFAKGGDLRLLLSTDSLNDFEDDAIYMMQFITEDNYGLQHSTLKMTKISNGESNGEGFYSCVRFLPRLFLKSRKDLFAKGGDLRLLLSTDSLNDFEDDAIYMMQFITEDTQEWFKELHENTSFELSIRGKEENDMPFQTDVGEILTDPNDAKWTIPNFWDLSHEYNTVIRSPRFHFVDRHWYMDVYPNGRRSYSSLGWFGVNVWNLNSDSSLRSVTVCVMDENSNKSCLLFSKDSRDNGSYCCTRLFPISLLKCWKEVVTPKGNLCLLLQIETEDDINTLGMRVASKYVHKWFKEKLENKDSFIEKSTQTEGEIVKEDRKQIYDDTCPVKSIEGKKGNAVEKLRQDFKEILLSGNISDIILKVEGQEFKAHKSILGARSPVFLAMMMHETKEKISDIVDIPDVDANIFPDFLSYLYTGSKDNLTSENAAKLYTISDKYQVNELKESCKDLMLMNISIENFCEVFTLSLRHDEKELKEACIQFFAKNSLDIVLTGTWQTFLCENPITGNELFIKHLKLNK